MKDKKTIHLEESSEIINTKNKKRVGLFENDYDTKDPNFNAPVFFSCVIIGIILMGVFEYGIIPLIASFVVGDFLAKRIKEK